MQATDCEILSESIPLLDAENCCDHAGITCVQGEGGELRVIYIIDTTGQFVGYAAFLIVIVSSLLK
jgi:hypothetical protein